MERNDLKSSAVSGIMWTSVSQVVIQILQFIFIVILARTLLPKDFGIVGMALIFTGLINMVNELGLAAAIIQKQEISDDHLSTAFWTGLFVGAMSFSFAVIAAPFIANFFNKEVLTHIVIVISVGFLIKSLGIVHITLLSKELAFKKVARVEIVSSAFYGLTTISLSLFGFGVWSLVLGYLSSITIETILLWTLNKWRPKIIFRFDALKDLFSFGVNVWLFNFINYGRENVDYFAIGRYLGATPLGFYTLAYNLANLPRRRLATIISRVTFPAFSKIQDEDERLSNAYLKTTAYISIIAFPLLTGLIIVAPEFVELLYGPKWLPMVLALRLLCVAGMLYSIGSTVGSIYLAKGRPDLQFKIGIVAFLFLTSFVFMGVRFGINGVAAAVTCYTIISLTVGQYFANNLISLKMKPFIFSLIPATLSSIAMAVVLVGFRFLDQMLINFIPILFLMFSILLGGAIYLVTMNLCKFEEYKALLSIIKEQLLPLREGTFIGRSQKKVTVHAES